jgi:PASTA domain
MADDPSAAAQDRETPGQAPSAPEATAAIPAVEAEPARRPDRQAAETEQATVRIPESADPARQPTQRVTPRIWAARVPILPDDVAPVREATPPEWEQPPEGEPAVAGGRQAVHPAVLTLIIVALLAMLGTGLWLTFHRSAAGPVLVPSLPPDASVAPTPADTATAGDTATPTEEPTPTEAPTATDAPTTAPAVPTQAPAPPPPPSSPALVAVPDGLVGLPVKVAEQRLTAVGLTYQVAGLPTGRVSATRPEAGTMVPRGSQVTLVVLRPDSPTPTAKAPAAE